MQLTPKDLQLIHTELGDSIDELQNEWERGRFKDNDLDRYIDQLCDVKNKISHILHASKN